jgi:phenylalanyl-tRNA synthetase beta chain
MRRVEAVLGEAVPADEVSGILDRLGFAPQAAPDEGGMVWHCRVPSHRLDVDREIDVIEEVARFHGYDRFAPRQYNAAGAAAVREPTERRLARSASVLVGLGFQEIVTSTFASSEEGRATAEWTWASGEPVALLNARSVDASVLRRSLWPEHLRVARRNLNRGATSLRLFEHGKTFGRLPSESWGRERWELSGILVGAREPAGWSGPAVPLDLFALKGILDAYFRRQRLASAEYAPYGGEALDPADAFRFQVPGGIRGVGGRVHPAAALRWDVPRDTWLFSIDFESLLELNEPSACYQEASRFPGVKRDLAFVVPAEVAQRDVREAMIESGGPWLRSVRLFDLYEGAPVPPGHKSLAYSLDFQSGERSLVGQEVDRLVLGIAGRLRERFGAVVREA